MVCEKWTLKFVMRKVKDIEEPADYVVEEFPTLGFETSQGEVRPVTV